MSELPLEENLDILISAYSDGLLSIGRKIYEKGVPFFHLQNSK
jgi:hypothetical protein